MRYFLIVLLAIVIFTSGCAKKESHESLQSTEAPLAESSSANSSGIQHKVLSFNLEGLADNGTKKWDVTGEAAEAVSEDKVKLDNIVARAYGEDATATITADKGVYNKSLNNVMLKENVKATIEGDQGIGEADFPSFPGQLIGPKGSKDEDNAKPKKTKTVITCDGEVQFDYEKNKAYFDKNVKVISEDGDIDADRITVNLDIATKKIKDIMAEGNVKITRGENITYSQKATYVEADKKIILTGRPKIILYQEGGLEGMILDKE